MHHLEMRSYIVDWTFDKTCLDVEMYLMYWFNLTLWQTTQYYFIELVFRIERFKEFKKLL